MERDPDTEKEQHYKKPLLEISALRFAMSDEALQVIGYTTEPSISQPDKKKPWIWMDKLQTRYSGTTGSTLMAEQFKLWHAPQNTSETIQDWKVGICQTGSLCELGVITDIMCCDKFVFGLCNNPIRKELLKTHLRPKNTTKAFGESFAEAKSLESVQNTDKIIHTTKGIDEAVNWTG